jgi:hypothetical protein
VVLTLGAFAVAAAWSAAGCGNSDASAPGDGGADGSLYNTAVTGGGGVPPAAALVTIPFTGSSGGSSGSSSSGGGGSSGGIVDAGPSDSNDDYVAPLCDGVNPCDLRANTCCLMNGTSAAMPLIGTCFPGTRTICNGSPDGSMNQATVHCLQSGDCQDGKSCCGEILVFMGQVYSFCKALSTDLDSGGANFCPLAQNPMLNALGVQLCTTDAECRNGQPCIHQLCSYGAEVHLCGLLEQGDGGLVNCTAIP